MRVFRRFAAVWLLIACGAPALAAPRGGAFDRLADEYLDRWLSRQPHVATRLGRHTTDDRLIPVTEASLEEDRAWTRAFRERLAAVPREQLSFEGALERDALMARVARDLLDLETIRPYENDPGAYLELITDAVRSVLVLDAAPLCARVRAVGRRLERVPDVLRAARVNLGHPPRIATEAAIAGCADALRFYREGVRAAAAPCKDPSIQAGLEEGLAQAITATAAFAEFLESDLLQRSTGDVALGAEATQRLLAAASMETTRCDALLARGLAELEAADARLAAQAERCHPGVGVRAALDSLARGAPAPGELVRFVEGGLDSIRGFLRRRALVTPPAREHLVVREARSPREGEAFPSVSAPGPWERNADEAIYHVPAPAPEWAEAQRGDHRAIWNRWAAPFVSIHAAVPGRYYQALAAQKHPSRLRQALAVVASPGGWAHYCERMAIEEGFGAEDPRFALAQEALATRRLSRLVAGLAIHTRAMTLEDAARLFAERCHLAPPLADLEARRVALHPESALETLDTWRVLELRDAVRARLGDAYRPRLFHDAFLRAGPGPLWVVRSALLEDLEHGVLHDRPAAKGDLTR